MRKLTLAILLLFTVINTSNAKVSDYKEDKSKGAKIRIIASYFDDKEKNTKLKIGVNFKIKEGWKIYGQDPNGFGIAPQFNFTNSSNISSHQTFWPQPLSLSEDIGNEIIEYKAYKNEATIVIIADLKDSKKPTNLNLEINYSLCHELCIPASGKFSLEIPTNKDTNALKFLDNPSSLDTGKNLKYILLIAIIGGAILNIMPCVLPVLSIKLISIINHSNSPIARIRFAFISTIIGILFCFIVLALIAISIKLTGNNFDWGLQFQNPYFLIFIFLILIFFIANLTGLFEISFSQFLSSLLNKKITQNEERHNVFMPNFLSGILAVLLATPCSAPFLGTAITFGLTQGYSDIILTFLFIGIGFALPYFILTISPKLVYLLPKPGAWMVKTKQLMAGFLAATLFWIAYVLNGNIGFLPSFLVVSSGILILAALRLKSVLKRNILIAILAIIALVAPTSNVTYMIRAENKDNQSIWVKFDENKIAQYVNEGKVVVVDVTANWCITCKFNKIRVLNSKEVVEKLKSPDIIAMRADITKPNQKVMEYLHKNNRFAIPFNAIYGPNAKDGLVTEVLISKKELFQLINKAK